MASFFDQWIMRFPDGTLSSAQLTYWHGRHRPCSNQHVRLVAGIWCRPGKVLKWEPINETDLTRGELGGPDNNRDHPVVG